MKKLKVTHCKSTIGATHKQKASVASLGFRRLNQVRILEDNPVNRGMINRVCHLLSVEEIES